MTHATSTPSHVAFDLGLQTTGVAWDDGSDHFVCPAKHRRSPITPAREHDRYCWWRDTFRMILLPHPTTTTVIVEAPFIHRRNINGSVGLVLLHGILRAVAIDGGHDFATVENRTLKKWATTKGTADKTAMMTAARRLGWSGSNHDEADAYLLWAYWATCPKETL